MRRALALLRRIFQTGHGRPAAVAMLVGLCAIKAFPDHSPFKRGQLELFGKYQALFPRQRLSAPVTIIDIDEASPKRYGQWPWPRNLMADLITRLGTMQPLAIGVDIYMPARDQTSPCALAARLPPELKTLGDALARLPDHDALVEAALRTNPTVIGAAGFELKTLTTSSAMRTVPLKVAGGDPLPFVPRYPFVLASLPEFQAAARGQALLSVDLKEGGAVRRLPLALAIGDALVPSLAMEMLRVATGSSAIELEAGPSGVAAAGVADLRVRTLPSSEVGLHLAKPMRHAMSRRNASSRARNPRT